MGGRRIGVLCLLLGACSYPTVATPATATPPPTQVATVTATPVAVQPTATAIPTAQPATPTSAPLAAATPVSASLAESSLATAPPVSESRILDIPAHRQEHALSCEAAALKMAMGSLGLDVAETEILARMPRDPTPRSVRADGSVVWGDPDVGFVGKFDGIYARDGYGVYDGPIAQIAASYGFSGTTHSSGINPEELYTAVRQGFPSVVWMPYGRTVKGEGNWATPAGKRIDYVVTEHTVVLAGVDESGVYYADPYTATTEYASYAAFERAMGQLGNRAVVLRT
jgi:uncharacterized protein YvpB